MRHVYAAVILIAGFVVNVSQVKAVEAVIHNGSQVAFDYTLTVEGKIVDTSEGKKPLEFTQGDGKLIPGLARQLEGLKAGEEKTIEVKPDEAYGNQDPKAFNDVPFSNLPAGLNPTVGAILQGKDSSGRIILARIAEVKKDSVLMDFNHPLAGKTLFFKIKIISIK